MQVRRPFGFVLFLAIVLLVVSEAEARRRVPSAAVRASKNWKIQKESLIRDYKTLWYTQTIDHFNFQGNQTYQQRYLVNDKYWEKQNGPMLFYTGNEGDIEWFYNNTGFVTDTLAKSFNALVVFAEHRYYGLSMPFGDQSLTPQNVGFLTSEQALADYAQLIAYLKQDVYQMDMPVLAFGGSYGGMLTAWFRLKYPQSVDGALAASAPVLQFYNTGVSQWAYWEDTTYDYYQANIACPPRVLSGLKEIQALGQSASGLAQLTQTFNLCQPLEQASDLLDYFNDALSYLAMANYPYPANFLEPMPGWPVQAFCNVIVNQAITSDVAALAAANQIYANYTGNLTCLDVSESVTPDLSDDGWDYQACSEMVMPISSNGTSDLFLPDFFNLTQYQADCMQTWGARADPNWVVEYYGFDFRVASNIIFSNGLLDPWHGGGVLASQSSSVVAVILGQGAHHLDLRLPNPLDPPQVTEARNLEIKYLQQFLEQAWAARKQRSSNN